MKTCNQCKKEKDESEFYRTHCVCKTCYTRNGRIKYRKTHPPKKQAKKKEKKPKIHRWRPKVGEKFDAYLVESDRKHCCSPFVRTEQLNKQYIHAGDWQFDPKLFYFVPVKK